MQGHWRWLVWLVDEFYRLSCIRSLHSSSLFPIQPLLSARWKSLITGGESNPWHWMKDEGLPLSLSHSLFLSLHFSMDAGYAWQVFSTSLSLPHFPAPSISLSIVFIVSFPLLAPDLFYVQVKVSWGNVPGRIQRLRKEGLTHFALVDDIWSCSH